MSDTLSAKNKELVLSAFDTLFNKRDYGKSETYWSIDFVQRRAGILIGRDQLFDIVKDAPITLTYQPGIVVAEGDYVVLYGRFSGTGRSNNWSAADVVKVVDHLIVEHWKVLEDEISKSPLVGDSPIYGARFGKT